jgi:hypothetical protein
MINILNTYTSLSSGFFYGVIGMLTGLICLIVIIATFKDRNTDKSVKVMLCTITLLFLLPSIFVVITSPRITYYYEVSITDDMNFKEFNSKYEIVSQRGEIYTITEKEK